MTDAPAPDPDPDAVSGVEPPAEGILAAALAAGPEAAPHPHERLAACPNCDTPFDADRPFPNYCPRCGQAAVLHPPSVAEFAHEFLGHYVALEGPLWRTLWLLLARPGELTHEYLRGRRRRYVLPLRLYLSASFLFFLAFKLLPSGEAMRIIEFDHPARGAAASAPAAASAVRAASAARARAADADEADEDDAAEKAAVADVHAAVAEARQAASQALAARGAGRAGPPPRRASGASAPVDVALDDNSLECDAGERVCAWFREHLQSTWSYWKRDPEAAQESFKAHWMGSAPYALFLMQPVFAGIVQLAYRRRHMRFGEHVVFSMHVHALWFLLCLVALPLPKGTGGWCALALAVYTVLALHRVYGGRWRPTLARAAVIGLVYSIALGLTSGVLSVLALLH